MFNLPDNPYTNHPERKSIVRTRSGLVIGCIATATLSIKELYGLPPLDVAREYFSFITFTSIAVGSLPIIAELQERFRSEGGGGGGWYVPDFPLDPSPGGLELNNRTEILV